MSVNEEAGYQEALLRIAICKNGEQSHLNLSDLGLSRLPPEIGGLTKITSLDVSGNNLATLPAEIGNLAKIDKIWLNKNKLHSLPKEFSGLSSLEKIALEDNKLESIPSCLSDIKGLKYLWMQGNAIRSISGDIGKLTNLIEINLWGNKVQSLPPEIQNLKSINLIWLQDNELQTLPPEIGHLRTLRHLGLENNNLQSLPAELAKLNLLKILTLHGNPFLRLPPEMVGPTYKEISSGKKKPTRPRDILDYYFDIQDRGGRPLREVKLILVGRGEVGKSSMADVLQGRKFIKNRTRTDGISISSWDVKMRREFSKILIWDFGGQEIMHGTHQFFLTHRSLYIVMVDGRHDRAKQDAEYWLKLVRAFGGNSTVMLVMNRQKGHPFDIDRRYLAEKYGIKLENFFRTDCERSKDISVVRKAVLKEVANMLKMEESFPSKCWAVKTRLTEMKAHGEDYLSDEQYAEICRAHGIADEVSQQKLLSRLADLGTVISFPDDVKLSELSVLNPEWTTDGIYRVLTNEALREQKQGKLTQSALRKILSKDRWPKPKHLRYLLDLMAKFELSFPIDDETESVLVPELLPDKTPPLMDWIVEQCVVFHYKYPVLPHGVFPRFVTRTHQLSDGQERWRSGVVLNDDCAEALIKADYDSGIISIWLRGPYTDGRRALLKIIRHHFEHIHAKIKELNPEQLVSLRGNPEILLPYEDLIKDERRGKSTIAVTINGERVDRPIKDFLDCIEAAAERRKETKKHEEHRSFHFASGAQYFENQQNMSNNHSINIGGDVTNSQIGQALTNCTNMISHEELGEKRDLLAKVKGEAESLISQLPENKREEAAGNLELMVKGATSAIPNRRWYEVSAEGLLQASKWAKDFTGNISGTIGKLGKLIWPDFLLPKNEGEQ